MIRFLNEKPCLDWEATLVNRHEWSHWASHMALFCPSCLVCPWHPKQAFCWGECCVNISLKLLYCIHFTGSCKSLGRNRTHSFKRGDSTRVVRHTPAILLNASSARVERHRQVGGRSTVSCTHSPLQQRCQWKQCETLRIPLKRNVLLFFFMEDSYIFHRIQYLLARQDISSHGQVSML